jgi:hypothetical protein
VVVSFIGGGNWSTRRKLLPVASGRAVVVVILWQLNLQLPMQLVSITTNNVIRKHAHGDVYSIQHYVIKFVIHLRQEVVFGMNKKKYSLISSTLFQCHVHVYLEFHIHFGYLNYVKQRDFPVTKNVYFYNFSFCYLYVFVHTGQHDFHITWCSCYLKVTQLMPLVVKELATLEFIPFLCSVLFVFFWGVCPRNHVIWKSCWPVWTNTYK